MLNTKIERITAIFIILSVSFETIRTFFQAIYSIYYLDRGLSIQDVSSIKVFQIVAILIFSIPSGYLADKIGRLKILNLSAIIMAISFFLLIFSYDYLDFAIAEFVYGIGFAFSAGAILTFVNQLQEEHEVRVNPKMMGYNISLIGLMTFTSGSIGAWLYQYNIQIPFYLSAIGMLIYPFLVYISLKFLGFKDNKVLVKNDIIKTITIEKRTLLPSEFNRKEFFIFLSISCLFTGGSQFIYQYWSVYFVNSLHISANISYVSLTLTSIAGGIIFGNIIDKKGRLYVIYTTVGLLSIPLLFLNNNYPLLSLFCFSLSQIGRGMMFSLMAAMANDVAFLFKNKSLMFQTVGTLVQVMSIVSLLTVSFILSGNIEMSRLFNYSGIIYIFLLPLILLLHKS